MPYGFNSDRSKYTIDNSNFVTQSDFETDVQNLADEIDNRKIDLEKVHVFDTVTQMKAAQNLRNGTICRTNGFHVLGDGGGAWYKIANTGTANEKDVIACGSLYATLIANKVVNPVMYGAYGDGSHNDAAVFSYLCNLGNKRIDLIDKEYVCNSGFQINSNTEIMNGKLNISGASRSGGAIISATSKQNIKIIGIRFIGSGAVNDTSVSYKMVHLLRCSYFEISECIATSIQFGYVFCLENCSNGFILKNKINSYSFTGINLLNGGQDISVCDNKVFNCINTAMENTYPIGLSSGDGEYERLPSSRIICIGNHIRNETAWWEGIDAHCIMHSVISNNLIENCYCGIAIAKHKSNVESQEYESRNLVISGNVIRMPGSGPARAANNAGIACSYLNYSEISGNQISDAGGIGTVLNACCGIYFDECAYCDVKNNYISVLRGNGMSITGSTNNNVFQGNSLICTETQYLMFFDGEPLLTYVINNYFHVFRPDSDTRYFRGGIKRTNTGISYVAFIGNETNITDGYRAAEGGILPDYSTWNPEADGDWFAGYEGFTIKNVNVASGQPIGWVCSSSASSGTRSHWVALPNYA